MNLMPRKGNTCAVIDCKEKWNRALVINVTSGKIATQEIYAGFTFNKNLIFLGYCGVRFIDIGITGKVPLERILKLENAFLFSDTLGRCQLSDVTPKQENNYE